MAHSNYISAWKSNGLFYESIKAPPICDNSLAPAINYINTKWRVKFDEHYLKQKKCHFLIKKWLTFILSLR